MPEGVYQEEDFGTIHGEAGISSEGVGEDEVKETGMSSERAEEDEVKETVVLNKVVEEVAKVEIVEEWWSDTDGGMRPA